jgi:hypothetical protein
MKDTTFIIPYQKDSEDRKNNVNFIINYLKSIGAVNIIVSCTTNEIDDFDASKFISPSLEFNYKTKLINEVVKFVTTKYICVNDTDVFTLKKNYVDSISALQEGYDYAVPYFVNMYNIPKDILTIGITEETFKENYPILWKGSVGGLYFADKEKFLSIGGENETMKGWGYEDFERNERARRLLLKIKYLKYNLWHIEHERKTENSHMGSFAELNYEIYSKLRLMKYIEIVEYIKTWIKA